MDRLPKTMSEDWLLVLKITFAAILAVLAGLTTDNIVSKNGVCDNLTMIPYTDWRWVGCSVSDTATEYNFNITGDHPNDEEIPEEETTLF